MSATYLHGSSPEALAEVESGSAACVVTDPPYGMAYVSSWTTHRATTRKIAGDAEWNPEAQTAWLREAYRVTRDGGALYAFIDDQHLGDMRACAKTAGWSLKRSMVWLKDAWTVGDLAGDYGHQTEFIVYAHKGRHLLNPPRESNVVRYSRVPPDQLTHTAEKPVALLRYLIRKSSRPGDLIVDPFAGVASCGVAAIAEGRRYVGVECDEAWWPEAERRLAEAQDQRHPAIQQDSLFSDAA